MTRAPTRSAVTIPGILQQTAREFGDLTAVCDGDVRLSFAELKSSAQEVSQSLLKMGIRHGDVIAVLGPNSWQWIAIALGLQSIGAVLAPVSTRLKGREIAAQLATARVRALFTWQDFLGIDFPAMIDEEREMLPHLDFVVSLPAPSQPATMGWAEFLTLGADVDPLQVEARSKQVRGDDISDIIFTSGTTGAPKGAQFAHGQTVEVYRLFSDFLSLAPNDRYLIVNPFSHTFGYKAGWLAALICGVTSYPVPLFQSGDVLERIEADRITVLPGPPTLYYSLLADPNLDSHDLTSLRVAITGAAAITPSLIHRVKEELGFSTVLTAYGLTENSGVGTITRADDTVEVIAGTCGRPFPGVEVRLGGESTSPSSEAAEILLRGFSVMQGYVNDRDATISTVDTDGWLHTGDIGAMDEAGNLKVLGRLKEMLIVGGFNVYPAEVESVIVEHPLVVQAAVVGAPDPRLGEVACAFVIPGAEVQISSADVITWVTERIANYKVPRYVFFVDELPTNAAGKVLKRQLTDQAHAMVTG